MPEAVDVKVFFNFRSPYCYIASKTMFQIFDDYHANLVWRPLGGWSGRSSPDRAKVSAIDTAGRKKNHWENGYTHESSPHYH